MLRLAATVTQDTSSNALPITHDNIHELTYAQSGDTMFLAHNTFMVRKTCTNWSYIFSNGNVYI